MAYQHPVFVRRIGHGKDSKIIVCTILDANAFKLNDNDNDVFFLATTESNIYNGNKPTITIEPTSKLQSEEYTGKYNECSTIGMSITGILTAPIWFVRKFKSVMEMMS